MRLSRRSHAWLLGPVAVGLLLMSSGGGASATVANIADGSAGSQGIDTTLPATDSQVTVNGRGAFANMAFTVNQTRKLGNQAISITWTGGTPTIKGPNRFGEHFVQMMQCWGDDDGTNLANPGPPPEQCEQGATSGKFGGVPPLSLIHI